MYASGKSFKLDLNNIIINIMPKYEVDVIYFKMSFWNKDNIMISFQFWASQKMFNRHLAPRLPVASIISLISNAMEQKMAKTILLSSCAVLKFGSGS